MLQELRTVYTEVIEPIETEYGYDQFKPSYFFDTLTCSTPLILFIGLISFGVVCFPSKLSNHFIEACTYI